MKSIPDQPFIIQLDVVDSTNNYAANLLKRSKVVNGTIILTKRQEKGKGQRGTNWQSAPDQNLTCSVIVYPECDVSRVFHLNMITSLAVCDTLRSFGLTPKIKWPNDIFVNGSKIAGILIETQIKGHVITSSIIGLGLNINQSEFLGSFQATSMINEIGEKSDIRDVALKFWANLQKRLPSGLKSENDRLLTEYYENLIGFEEKLRFEDENGSFFGTIKGVDEMGRLCVMDQKNEVRKYQIKEVKQLFD